jgi:hypothetical protein
MKNLKCALLVLTVRYRVKIALDLVRQLPSMHNVSERRRFTNNALPTFLIRIKVDTNLHENGR